MFFHLFKFPTSIRTLKLLSPRKPPLCCSCNIHTLNGIFKADKVFSKQNLSIITRKVSNKPRKFKIQSSSPIYYITALGVVVLGFTYAAVPLYRIFCQATSYGGTVTHSDDPEKVAQMKKVASRPITINFNADLSSSMRWNFKPQQKEITVYPGETALAFYTATNPTSSPIVGISTYNVVPFDAGQYFNKIQCFCFEEQQLNPNEEVDMPVFFYIDPEFADDPKMEDVDTIILSYTFFESKEGFKLPIPSYAQLNKHGG